MEKVQLEGLPADTKTAWLQREGQQWRCQSSGWLANFKWRCCCATEVTA